MRISIKIAIAIMLAVLVHDQAVASEATAVLAITQKHCIECHGPDAQEGDVRFDKLTGSPQEEPVWASILEQLEKGAMPPKDEPRLSREEHSAFTAWIERSFPKAAQAMAQKMQLPENGNFVPHEKLFDPETAKKGPEIAASPARFWRTLPVSYRDKMDAWLKSHGAINAKRGYGGDVLAAPFGLQTAQEIKNYSFLYTLEGAQTAGLANNARLALIRVVDYNPKDGRSLIRKLAVATESPSTEDVDKVIVDLYHHWIGRSPDEKELTAKRTIVLERAKKLGNRAGLVAGLVPIMIHPEAFFHAELGTPKTPGEPTFLPPDELIDALDRALRDRRGDDPMRKDANWQIAEGKPEARDFFVVAAKGGKLHTREDVLAVLEQIAADERMPRLSQSETARRFLVEYFDYPRALSVFKCEKDLRREHAAHRLLGAFHERLFHNAGGDKVVIKTRAVIDKILEEDKQVLAQLLTIPTDDLGRSDASYEAEIAVKSAYFKRQIRDIGKFLENKNLEPENRAKLEKEYARREKILAGYLAIKRNVYSENGTFHEIGPDRSGVLTQRSWLVSFSTNFENHPIHRGKWIRERLLGGRIPDVPITVDAALPEDPSKTLRERMQKTRNAECWKCHRLMDPLGLPFEQFDHFGSLRETELDRPVVTSGEIIESGDPSLDGPVAGPAELVKKLAASERVQQVFVRHAFRFWMGRNETLDDAGTIQNAHLAYKESDGSMSELLKSLLTSDAFLYRTGALSEGDKK